MAYLLVGNILMSKLVGLVANETIDESFNPLLKMTAVARFADKNQHRSATVKLSWIKFSVTTYSGSDLRNLAWSEWGFQLDGCAGVVAGSDFQPPAEFRRSLPHA